MHLSDNISENIEVLKQFEKLNLQNLSLIETKRNGELLYLIIQEKADLLTVVLQ